MSDAQRGGGVHHHVTLHVQTDGNTTLDVAHALGGGVKRAIQARSHRVSSVLVHMEPYESE